CSRAFIPRHAVCGFLHNFIVAGLSGTLFRVAKQTAECLVSDQEEGPAGGGTGGMGTTTVKNFDYVIVGGGTAGCVLANRLSADPATRVLMIEAGGKGKAFYVDMPMGLAFLIGNPKYDWVYKSEPEPHLDGRRMN